MMSHKQIKIYLILVALVISGLATTTVTTTKVVHFMGINFPFSNVVFSLFTFPIVDCICELWGKKLARQAVWLALGCQLLIALLIQWSIAVPYAPFWALQHEYQDILSTSGKVVIASLLAFATSQILDIIIFQRIKEASNGKWLWLRSNISTILGQLVDSSIFITIVFYASAHKFNILIGSFIIKMILSILMTPVVYLIVIAINKYLNGETLAFKESTKQDSIVVSSQYQ